MYFYLLNSGNHSRPMNLSCPKERFILLTGLLLQTFSAPTLELRAVPLLSYSPSLSLPGLSACSFLCLECSAHVQAHTHIHMRTRIPTDTHAASTSRAWLGAGPLLWIYSRLVLVSLWFDLFIYLSF